ncbi:MAG: hypothetical protein M1812_006250 [Candelaria pacifica]|nr:MAG: hypothetical protein M1812_006250 [Candelaria pacifica]
MSAHQSYYQTTLPINMSAKSPYYNTPHHASYGQVSMSPPEVSGSATTSGMHSATSSSYAGSASGEYDSSGSSAAGSGVDLVELLNDRMTGTFDPLPLDRGLAKQAQTSGELNAKHRELMELQALAQRRLASTRANFADGMKAAKDVKKDLDWTQKRVSALKTKAERKYPKEYKTANNRYPAAVDY